MKRLAAVMLLTLSVTIMPIGAQAQDSSVGQPLGWLFLSDSNTAPYVPCVNAGVFTPFTVYLMVSLSYSYIGPAELDDHVGLVAWEASVEVPGLGPDIIIRNATFRNDGEVSGTDTNVQHEMSAALVASETPIDLVQYDMVVFNSDGVSEVELSIGPSSPSSLASPAPGFRDSEDIGECRNPVTGEPQSCLRPFAKLSPAIINYRYPEDCYGRRPVAETRWGAIKARYAH